MQNNKTDSIYDSIVKNSDTGSSNRKEGEGSILRWHKKCPTFEKVHDECVSTPVH